MLRFLTAGESHGPELVVIVEGLPAGVVVDGDAVDRQLVRRQQGYGRGARSTKIERDHAEIVSGVAGGATTGAPVAMRIVNKDFANQPATADAAHRAAAGPRRPCRAVEVRASRTSGSCASGPARARRRRGWRPARWPARSWTRSASGWAASSPRSATCRVDAGLASLDDEALARLAAAAEDDDLRCPDPATSARDARGRRRGEGGRRDARRDVRRVRRSARRSASARTCTGTASWTAAWCRRSARSTPSRAPRSGRRSTSRASPGTQVQDPIVLANGGAGADLELRRRPGGRHDQRPARRRSRGDEAAVVGPRRARVRTTSPPARWPIPRTSARTCARSRPPPSSARRWSAWVLADAARRAVRRRPARRDAGRARRGVAAESAALRPRRRAPSSGRGRRARRSRKRSTDEPASPARAAAPAGPAAPGRDRVHGNRQDVGGHARRPRCWACRSSTWTTSIVRRAGPIDPGDLRDGRRAGVPRAGAGGRRGRGAALRLRRRHRRRRRPGRATASAELAAGSTVAVLTAIPDELARRVGGGGGRPLLESAEPARDGRAPGRAARGVRARRRGARHHRHGHPADVGGRPGRSIPRGRPAPAAAAVRIEVAGPGRAVPGRRRRGRARVGRRRGPRGAALGDASPSSWPTRRSTPGRGSIVAGRSRRAGLRVERVAAARPARRRRRSTSSAGVWRRFVELGVDRTSVVVGRRRRRGARRGRVRRRDVRAGRSAGERADDAARHGRREPRRQDGDRPRRREELRRRVPPSAAGAGRPGGARVAAGARPPRRARRGGEDGGDRVAAGARRPGAVAPLDASRGGTSRTRPRPGSSSRPSG